MAKDKDRIIALVEGARHMGALPEADGTGMAQEPNCEDEMRFFIRSVREMVTEIGYEVTDTACFPLKAAAEAAARLAVDKPVMEAYLVTAQQIGEALGGLDKEDVHCAMMAELALKSTIVDYVNRRNARLAQPAEG